MAFLEFYKKGQGTLARILGVGSCFALAGWGGYALWKLLRGTDWGSRVILKVPHVGLTIDVALVVGLFVACSLAVLVVWVLNRPRSVDLLIETEGEMRKVSWPSRQEAWNSSLVVVITVLFLMGLLFCYDVVLNQLLRFLFYRKPTAEVVGGVENALLHFGRLVAFFRGGA